MNATVKAWSAWAPGLESPERWHEWASGNRSIDDSGSPPMRFLPPMFRRRLSRLSKMALKAAHDCAAGVNSVKTVFCSRHGELVRVTGLLESIIAGEPISPTGFSMSVHNTAAGLFSIAGKDTAASTSIAAGKATFEAAFMEAAAMLATHRARKVLLVVGDEPLPAPFARYADEEEKAYAAALLLGKGGTGDVISLTMEKKTGEPMCRRQHGLEFLRFFLAGGDEMALNDERVGWRWKRWCP